MTEIKYDSSQFPEYLQIYYKRLFPYGPYYKWLTYGLAPQVSTMRFWVCCIELWSLRRIIWEWVAHQSISCCRSSNVVLCLCSLEILRPARIFVHAPRRCVHSVSILQRPTRDGKGNSEKESLQNWHRLVFENLWIVPELRQTEWLSANRLIWVLPVSNVCTTRFLWTWN